MSQFSKSFLTNLHATKSWRRNLRRQRFTLEAP